ncbi:hypothetical protein MST27_20010, partial [Pseudomonas sp. PS1]|nr:hypothetical protein [Pseudomonas marianensis]
QRPKPLSTTPFHHPDHPTRAASNAQPPPCQLGAFYSNPPSVQALYLDNLLIYKWFFEGPAPEKVRIIGRHTGRSTHFSALQ